MVRSDRERQIFRQGQASDMIAGHHADGPDGRWLSGPGATSMIASNDNRLGDKGLSGLVLSAERSAAAAPMIAIRAMDRRGRLGAPLHVSCSDQDIIALWRGLGRDFNLPLFLRDGDGVMTPLAPPARMYRRGRGSPLSGRRPRFLARRKGPAGPCTPSGADARREG
jgi:hypothetical protein